MTDIALFAEDFGHEEFVGALIQRIALEAGIKVSIHPRSVRGGHGKVLTELRQYLADIQKGRESLPDLLVVATDANCEGPGRRRKVEHEAESFTLTHPGKLVVAVPNPHVERWMLIVPGPSKQSLDVAATRQIPSASANAINGPSCRRCRPPESYLLSGVWNMPATSFNISISNGSGASTSHLARQ